MKSISRSLAKHIKVLLIVLSKSEIKELCLDFIFLLFFRMYRCIYLKKHQSGELFDTFVGKNNPFVIRRIRCLLLVQSWTSTDIP